MTSNVSKSGGDMKKVVRRKQDHVCHKCVNDDALAEIIKTEGSKGTCAYCQTPTVQVLAIKSLAESISSLLQTDFTDEPEVAGYSSSEGDGSGTALSVEEVFESIDYVPDVDELVTALAGSMSPEWWVRESDRTMSSSGRWRAGWTRFKRAVKYHRRFTFWSMGDDENEPGDPAHLPVGEMLKEIGKVVRAADLLKTVKKGSGFWRVRVHDADMQLKSNRGLTPPPQSKALQPNRMSPSGVVMFYGSEDYETACKETIDVLAHRARAVTGGIFKAKRDLLLLDLVNLPEVPSYFDIANKAKREALSFLPGFAKDLSSPVKRDGREHVDYVPTQAFTEYVRFRMKGENKASIDGIRYPSAHDGKACVVLFCGSNECETDQETEVDEPWLALDAKSVCTKLVRKLAFLEVREMSARKDKAR